MLTRILRHHPLLFLAFLVGLHRDFSTLPNCGKEGNSVYIQPLTMKISNEETSTHKYSYKQEKLGTEIISIELLDPYTI